MQGIEITPLNAADRDWANTLLIERWGSTQIVSNGQVHDCSALPGFVARYDSIRAGLITYRIYNDECEIMTLDSLVEGCGIGTELLAAVEITAQKEDCGCTFLITSNDNLHALGFYQRRGYRLAAVYPNAIDAARDLKPQIPLIGMDDIPLHDEIELHKIF